MKARTLIIVLMILCSAMLSTADGIERDYWPTREWRLSSPEKQGMSSSKISEMAAYVETELPNAANLTAIRNGYIVYEKNFYGDSDTLREVYSVTKSILSALIGIAIRDKFIDNIDHKANDYLPEMRGSEENLKNNTITLKHLLTLSDGLARNDMDDFITGDLASRELRNIPGQQLFYNSLSPQILSAIITKATGLKALDFGKVHLFGPLGISNMRWQEAFGYSRGATGIALTTRDMAKIGYLYLNKGKWEGKQMLPEQWVDDSTRVEIEVKEVPFFSIRLDYGFLWWIHKLAGYNAFSAVGWGGQYITVVPELDLVVVIATVEYSHANAPKYLSLIEDFIIPSILH